MKKFSSDPEGEFYSVGFAYFVLGFYTEEYIDYTWSHDGVVWKLNAVVRKKKRYLINFVPKHRHGRMIINSSVWVSHSDSKTSIVDKNGGILKGSL